MIVVMKKVSRLTAFNAKNDVRDRRARCACGAIAVGLITIYAYEYLEIEASN